MAFSLSPSVSVLEKNASFGVANLPSSNIGMVLRSDHGPAMKVINASTVTEYVDEFGIPTTANYVEWFNGFNVLQYVSTLYVARPLDVGTSSYATKNVALAMSGTYTQGWEQSGLYNNDVAEVTIPSLTTTVQKSIAVFTKPASDYIFTHLGIINGQQLTQKATTGADSGILQLDGEDCFEILNSGATTTVHLIGTGDGVTGFGAQVSGWKSDECELTLDTGDGASFVAGEVVSQATTSASGTIAVGGITGDVLTLESVSGVFDLSAVIGNVAGGGDVTANMMVGEEGVGVFPSVDDAGTVTITGTFENVRLIFYNKETTSDQNMGIAICSSEANWSNPVCSSIATNWNDLFEYQPNFTGNEEFAVVVYQYENAEYTVLEKHVCSYSTTARDIGNKSMYAENVFMNKSDYLYCVVGSTASYNVETTGITFPALHHSSANTIYPITSGTESFPGTTYDGNGYDQGDFDAASNLFADPDSIDINILLEGDVTGSEKTMSEIAKTRKDCITIVAPYDHTALVGKSSSLGVEWLKANYGSTVTPTTWTGHSNTYAAVYGNMKYQYDPYNDINRWVPLHGDIAGLYAQTDINNDAWWAPAGLRRGQVKNVIKLAFNPNKAGRDVMYLNAINPIISLPGEGAGIILGQKTATSIASAMDRVNVRRLLITIEKAIATALRPFMFEFNDEGTRNSILGIINPYLANIKARRGVYDFLVVCDTTNNTNKVIDSNGLLVDVFVKPTKVAEFIKVNVVVTDSGASFSEVVV